MCVLTKSRPGPKLGPRLIRVRIRMCSNHCSACAGSHEFTEPMDATRIDAFRVRITEPHGNWFGAVVTKGDYEIVEDDQ